MTSSKPRETEAYRLPPCGIDVYATEVFISLSERDSDMLGLVGVYTTNMSGLPALGYRQINILVATKKRYLPDSSFGCLGMVPTNVVVDYILVPLFGVASKARVIHSLYLRLGGTRPNHLEKMEHGRWSAIEIRVMTCFEKKVK